MSRPQDSRFPYLPGIDALRALAVGVERPPALERHSSKPRQPVTPARPVGV